MTDTELIKQPNIFKYLEKDNSEQPSGGATTAQPSKPVAYAVYHRMGGSKSLHWPEQHSPDGDANEYQLVPLYTSPPAQRKPLTDEQIEQCMKQAYSTVRGRNLELAFARAIESAHGITKE